MTKHLRKAHKRDKTIEMRSTRLKVIKVKGAHFYDYLSLLVVLYVKLFDYLSLHAVVRKNNVFAARASVHQGCENEDPEHQWAYARVWQGYKMKAEYAACLTQSGNKPTLILLAHSFQANSSMRI